MTRALFIAIHPPPSQFSGLQEFLGQAIADFALFPPPALFNRLMTATQTSVLYCCLPSPSLQFHLEPYGIGQNCPGKRCPTNRPCSRPGAGFTNFPLKHLH